MEPLVTHRFPAPMVIRAGDTLNCSFTISSEMGNCRIEEAILLGTAESRTSAAQQLAHILDSLEHFRARDLPAWNDCEPRRHIDRAIRELAHALLALTEEGD
jgi:hypothetical protein